LEKEVDEGENAEAIDDQESDEPHLLFFTGTFIKGKTAKS